LRSLNTYRDRRRILLWFIAGLAGLSIGPAYAIDPNRAMSQYIHDRWGPERGFPRGPVYAIAQTPDGYLWIGTDAGLVRFDGLNFRLMLGNSTSTPTNSVLGLTVDREGNLWVRLQGPTMLRYRDGVFEDAMLNLGMPYSNITTIARTNQGDLLVGRLEDGSIQYRGGRFEVLRAASPLARSPVLSLARTGEGDLWMGTRDAGLFRAAGKQTIAISKGLPDTKINCLLPDGDHDLWVGTDNGLVRWNGSELTSVGIPAALNNFQALAMARDRDGNIWVGTDSRGLLRFNTQGVSLLDPDHRGTGEAVTALFEDREGNLWIGSAGSLERLRDSAFVTYSLLEGLPADGSNPVFVDAEKRVWFPPISGGLWWFKDGQRGRVDNAELEKDVVYSIAGGKDELWLGRQHGGLSRLRTEGNSFKLDTWNQADGLAQNSVYSVYQTRSGTVWAGTLSGGASSFENGQFKNYTTANGLASNTVSSILEGADGTMWFATPNGLSALAKDHWQTYTARDGLPSENLNCLLEDSTGVLWVGTVYGIAFRGPHGFVIPRGAPLSLREQILGIAEDRFGSLWVSTSNHVLHVKRDKLLQGTLADGDVREYGLADGLRGLEGVKRHQSVVADPLGRIWFSMNRGISVVDPERLKSDSILAMVQVQTIAADGNSIRLQGPVRIPANPKRIVFGLAGLSLSVPERVRFRYSLDGFDHGWSEPTTAHEAAYTNLGPGSYRFRVIASNPDGVWNNQETVLQFSIAPLFWQTWWFRVTGVVLFGLAVLAFYRLRLQQVTSRLNVRFEERLAERTRIAQELHDTLLQGFLSASMQLHVAADYVPEDSPAKQPLGRIIQLMGQVIEEGRTALRGLRSSQSASLSLEQAFYEIKNELAIEDEIQFRVIADGLPRPLHPILRDEVYRIGREALVNAFRHSHAKAIEVELGYTPRYFRFLVRDNGCGIAPDVVESGREGHWGLPGMRERAESIGAQLHVWSSAAAGTEVVLSVPGSVAFQHEFSAGRRGWFGKRHSGRNGIRDRETNGSNK
jgi:signal transduction histidine kinase/ligand-binding sensor domain-containing protein